MVLDERSCSARFSATRVIRRLATPAKLRLSAYRRQPGSEHDPTNRLALWRLSVLTCLAVSCVAADASGQNAGKRLYATISSCEMAHVLTQDQCRNAHANALAELDEKSPRFASRTDCEKSFKHCMIAGFHGQRAEFEPALRGFEVNARSETDKTVLPVLEGDSSSLGFRARTVLRMDAGISVSMREQAQKRWTQVQNARATTGAPGGDPDTSGSMWDSAPPNIAPVRPMPPTENDLAAAAHRRQEIRNAPTVY